MHFPAFFLEMGRDQKMHFTRNFFFEMGRDRKIHFLKMDVTKKMHFPAFFLKWVVTKKCILPAFF
jgi:hypothetical protein